MAKKNKHAELSIIVTAHNEGILAHKTMLSLFRATKKLEEEDIPYEFIVHIDNGTLETKKYFSKYENDKRIKVFENNFGDPSLSRNFAIAEANGRYVASIDGDDLCSENWLIDSYVTIKDSDDKIARMNYIVTFGGANTVITRNRQLDQKEAILYLLDSNAYAAPFVCSKKLFLSIKQRENKSGYAYEDWQFTADAMAQGVEQVIIPETALFYRRNLDVKSSVLSSHDSAKNTLSPTELFSFENISNINVPGYEVGVVKRDLQSRIKRKLRHELKLKSYHTIKYLKSFKTIARAKEAIKPSREKVVAPEWLIAEWKCINKIEKTTFPSKSTLSRAVEWFPNRGAGVGYAQIVKELKRQPDTLFFVPWLIRGGADKVFINTANEIAERHPDWNIAMVQTLRHPSIWREKVCDKVDFVDIADILQNLEYNHQLRLMSLFVSQNNIKRIIIGNSKFAYDFVLQYKTLVKAMNIQIYAFAFTELIDPDGRVTDYIHEDLPFISDVVYRIVTDNTSIVDQLYEEHAIDKKKIHVHHQFLNNAFRKPTSTKNTPLKVLWASRVSRQKVPEVLLEIGKKLSADFSIDVYGEIEVHYSKSFFEGSGVNYARRFNGIDDLPVDNYDIFLYTSSADGMPNILLEIGSKGLPIVAPDVGGVKDFIRDKETGLLISDYRDVDAYIEALEVLKDPELRIKLATNAQSLLRQEFTEKKWKEAIGKIFDR